MQKPTLLLAATILAIAVCGTPASADDAAQGHAFWGKPSVDGGKCCENLQEVRDNIDRIDRDIVKLMAERQKYVAEAGRFKPSLDEVNAPARIEQVVAKARRLAQEQGLSEDVVEKTYRAMVAAFTEYERSVWHKE
ncbi:chorismate mutase [Methylovirgula sp. 4M-Z18]|uniref:chorismate mutase n=1 Tax=Methylovirgula sp. 4M-Z18 TaxID=2293567 RepID=UPI000E2FC1D6|nr:chorismate mutase [Methylovirgula sp. 4M-Z18]RFB79242.1 chorismate mutase [Methylovirgula sp. 4M-Z18]